MRKVLIYRNEVLPISETFIRSQADALQTFEARFVGLKKIPDGLPVHSNSILLTEDNSLISKVKRQIFKQFAIAPRFLRRLRQEKPDLIHAHFALDGVCAMRLADELHVPLIVTLHGYDVTIADAVLGQTREGRRYLKRREELWRKATKFLCSCKYIMNRAAATGFPKEKMEVLYSGHNLSKYSPAVEPRNRNLVLYVGRLVEKKGGPYLIRAVAKVAEVHPEVELVIIGGGPLLEPMQDLARELKINCRFLGKLMVPEPGNSVYDWMRRARVFCAPSITASDGNTEGQPAVFVEAHALGLPAVSFQTAGIGEAVLHGETGLLAPEKDVDTLAEYLLRFLRDDPFWQTCSERAQRWVWERFNLDVLTQQLQRVYVEALEPRPHEAEDDRYPGRREVQVV
ncbi:MAG: glycosyltransferase [Terriglobales bacterium]|jgi:glycosyltransferase involved in cell wall biosynthesis